MAPTIRSGSETLPNSEVSERRVHLLRVPDGSIAGLPAWMIDHRKRPVVLSIPTSFLSRRSTSPVRVRRRSIYILFKYQNVFNRGWSQIRGLIEIWQHVSLKRCGWESVSESYRMERERAFPSLAEIEPAPSSKAGRRSAFESYQQALRDVRDGWPGKLGFREIAHD